MRRLFILLVACAVAGVDSQYTGCDYVYNYTAGNVGYVASPNFSQYYPAGTKCRYTINAPVGYYLYVQCYDMYLPSSTGCYYDKLKISTSGDSNMADASAYCGSTTFNTQSQYNKLVMALETPSFSYGGRFKCQITAVQISCDCGRRKTPKIVNGVITDANEYPMMAALLTISTNAIFCGATIVTDRYALTAAHCFLDRSVSNTALLVGEQNLDVTSETPYSVAMQVATFISHPSYDAIGKTSDIGLVRTSTTIQFNTGVGRVCLPFAYASASFDNVALEALGWGALDFAFPSSRDLRKTTLYGVPQASCQAQLQRTIISSQICMFANGNDTCQNDSGGPLFYTNTNSFRVYEIGITGFGTGCATSKPSVNTRVTSFLNWIVTTTGFTFCERI